jgi:hypothetical protein
VKTTVKAPFDWLLEGEAYIEYRTRLDLLNQSEDDVEVKRARRRMLADPKIQALIGELVAWPGTVISSHKSAGQPFHKLAFLADLGLRAGDPKMERIIVSVMKHQDESGPFQLPMNIPTHFGGSGRDEWAWALCDAPTLAYALMKFGVNPAKVRPATQYLTDLIRDSGWPCAVSKELGKFRGPGRKDDPCPYATLIMLKLLAATERHDSPAARAGAEALLHLWQDSREQHPYMFFMGTDFRKLKTPLIWYDFVHVLYVLSQFQWLRRDARLQDMLKLLKSKADKQGRYTPESIWTAWKDWEFGQKREPSRWLTLQAWTIIKRMESFSA